MNKRSTWFSVGGIFAAFAIGLLAGWLIGGDGGGRNGTEQDEDIESAQEVPQACVDAINAARERLILTDETRDLASEYTALLDQAVEAVRDGRADEIGDIVERADELNRRAGALLDDSTETSFSALAGECEELAEE